MNSLPPMRPILVRLLVLGAVSCAHAHTAKQYFGTVLHDIYFDLVCPPTGTYNVTMPGVGVGLSSNLTLTPFGAAPVPVASIYPAIKDPLHSKVCDKHFRCIEAYEITAVPITVDFGFRGPNGEELLSDMIAYDGQVPGPTIYATQGVQTMVRLINNISCPNSSIPTPDYYSYNDGLTLHLHGAASLSPFDGWTNDLIPACKSKDYVYPNEKSQLLWYHDHANDFTEKNVEYGLAGGYYVRTCNGDIEPLSLKELGDPIYMFIQDRTFNQTSSDRMQPYADFVTPIPTSHMAFGDHNMINGHIWPNVEVERKAYRWILLNAASYRVFNLVMQDALHESIMGDGFFYIVGGDSGLRQVPVMAQDGLLIAPGERYQVVIDFSAFEPGTVLYLNNVNGPQSPLPNPMFCYSALVMRFTVVGGTNANNTNNSSSGSPSSGSPSSGPSSASPSATGSTAAGSTSSASTTAASEPSQFSPFWNLADQGYRVLENQFFGTQMEQLCKKAIAGGADRKIQTQADPATGFTFVGSVGDSGSNAPGGNQYPASFLPGTNVFLPTSVAVDGFETWEVYSNITQSAALLGNVTHPIHLHLIDLVICGRKNKVMPDSIRDYELFTPKDTFMVAPYDTVWVLARFGPHQGSYMFHCHNLGHEDAGLMAAFNVSNPFKASRTKTAYGPYATNPERYSVDWNKQMDTPAIYKGNDPLVVSVPGTHIGIDLYFPESMPSSAMRRDPSNPSKPQPITIELLRKVLERSYYEVFYPKRKNLATKVKGSKFAVMCTR